jgi:hypothetical protein
MGDDFFADLTPVRKPRSVMGDLPEDEEERLRRQGSPGAAVTAGGPGFVAVEPDVAPTKVDFGDYVANRLKLGFSNLVTLLSSSEAEKQVLRGGQPYFGFEPATQPDLVTRMFGAGVEAVPMVALPVPLRGASLFARGRTGAVTGAFGAGAGAEFAGGIGQEIAVRAKAFGMRIFGSSRNARPLANFDKVVGANEWKQLLPESEFVVIATPLTPETKGLIDLETLRLFRPDAYLINIARGAIVDESALTTALQEGWIAGAALDTAFTEPLPAESPLWTLPNVFITPHCSGNSPRVKERTLALFLDNFNRYCQGKPLRNVVDKTAGY